MTFPLCSRRAGEDYVSGFGKKDLPFETEKAIKSFAAGPVGRRVGM
jgi:hypothetical protein